MIREFKKRKEANKYLKTRSSNKKLKVLEKYRRMDGYYWRRFVVFTWDEFCKLR